MKFVWMRVAAFIVPVILLCGSAGAEDALVAEARRALRRAVEFYSKNVASHGGYLYRYSADLQKREGEGKAGVETVWVQPPGTPAVGMALLNAHITSREPSVLEAARAAGDCLVRGQLRSGGWNDRIEFAPADRNRFSYRVDPVAKRPGRNWTTFDDDKSQSAMRFLMRLDQTLEFRDQRIHECITYALDAVLKAQFPNGAWPQGFEKFPESPDKYPVVRASVPESWPREFPGGDYWVYYTFNDNAIADTIDMLFLATEIYQDPKYRAAALKAGEFILLAQLPEPQPAWAQQYNFQMQPIWARKFEPPAVTGGESQGVMQILMRLYEESGDKRFLEPIPRALNYLRRSELKPGQLARFYELQTNRPLYFTKQYALTYDDSDLPTHYGFKVGSRLDLIERTHAELVKLDRAALEKRALGRRDRAKDAPSESAVRMIVKSLDERGAWVESGRLRYHGPNDDTREVIDSATFSRNIEALGRFLGKGD